VESTQSKADHGDAEAQFSLGEGFTNGKGTEADDTEAVLWYRKAADQGHAMAQFSLGMMFADGRGLPRDDAKAALWLCRAARQGHAEAQHSLGLRHRRASFQGLPGDALESNLEAYKWFRLAAAKGYRRSDAELECIALILTREQVREGDQRADRFVITESNPIQISE
jgi:TPR repeat protein